MKSQLLDYKLRELLGLTRKYKLEAITMLIDSIADDKAFEVKADLETKAESEGKL